MKITIDVTDTTFDELLESLKLIADSDLSVKNLEEFKNWLRDITVTEATGPVELVVFKYSTLP